jgi:ATP-binding cassette, subfamily B, bacterial
MSTAKLFSFFPALQRLGDPLRGREVPLILQTMEADCGAACLTMVLGYHGRHVQLAEVREALSVGRDGVTARALLETAGLFALEGRGVRIEPADLVHLPTGAILHWRFSHFVVLERLDGSVAHIVDPQMGKRAVPMEEVQKAFTGVALILEPRADFRAGGKEDKIVWRYLRSALSSSNDWGRIALISILTEALTLLQPLIMGRLIDRVIPRNDQHLLTVLVLAFVTAAVFYMLATLVRGQLLLHLRTRFDARLTMGFVRHVMRLPYDFFERRQPADLQLRVTSVATIRETLTGAVLSGTLDSTLVVVHLMFLALLSAKMLGIALLVVAVQGAVYVLTRKRIRELSANTIVKQAEAANALNELLCGIESLKSSGREEKATHAWASHYVDVLNIGIRRGGTMAASDALLNTMNVAGPVLLLITGIAEVMEGRMTLGTMLSANAMAIGFIHPMMNLITTLQQLQTARAQLVRIDDVLATAPEEAEDEGRRQAPPLAGAISLDHVSFKYGARLPLAVKDVSVHVAPGELVAIVGRSGSGKTTMGRLLLGLYPPTEGAVRFDGMPLGQLDLTSVRRQLGVVVQKPHIFGATVRANIALGDAAMPLDRVIQAAQRARLHDDILKMPMGYDTPIVAGGASLSGGQRQRLALARALVNEPSILLLDEATSSLDGVTEAEVKYQLDLLRCTRIFIAHRLSTIVNADRILVMEDGALVEQGRHDELLRRDGVYARLVAAQLSTPGAAASEPAPGRRAPHLQAVRQARPASPTTRMLGASLPKATSTLLRAAAAAGTGWGPASAFTRAFDPEEATAVHHLPSPQTGRRGR